MGSMFRADGGRSGGSTHNKDPRVHKKFQGPTILDANTNFV